jgi:hypothetical protein
VKKNKMLTSAAVALVLPIAYAAGPPELREGLWSIHTQSTDSPGNKKSESTRTLCRNHAYDKSVEALAKTATKGCTTVDESVQGGKISVDMHCVVEGTAIDSKETATYGGDTSTHSEIHTTFSPALAGMSGSTTITDQKYIGSCPAGAQPGDQTNADGTVTHFGKTPRP